MDWCSTYFNHAITFCLLLFQDIRLPPRKRNDIQRWNIYWMVILSVLRSCKWWFSPVLYLCISKKFCLMKGTGHYVPVWHKECKERFAVLSQKENIRLSHRDCLIYHRLFIFWWGYELSMSVGIVKRLVIDACHSGPWSINRTIAFRSCLLKGVECILPLWSNNAWYSFGHLSAKMYPNLSSSLAWKCWKGYLELSMSFYRRHWQFCYWWKSPKQIKRFLEKHWEKMKWFASLESCQTLGCWY